jgi:hypothetical protein
MIDFLQAMAHVATVFADEKEKQAWEAYLAEHAAAVLGCTVNELTRDERSQAWNNFRAGISKTSCRCVCLDILV